MNAAVFALSGSPHVSLANDGRMPEQTQFWRSAERIPSPVARRTRTNELTSYGAMSWKALLDVDSMTNTCNITSDVRINAADARNLNPVGKSKTSPRFNLTSVSEHIT
jgi:hypothetical protein